MVVSVVIKNYFKANLAVTLRFLAHIAYIARRVLDNNAQPEVLFPVGLKAMV